MYVSRGRTAREGGREEGREGKRAEKTKRGKVKINEGENMRARVACGFCEGVCGERIRWAANLRGGHRQGRKKVHRGLTHSPRSSRRSSGPPAAGIRGALTKSRESESKRARERARESELCPSARLPPDRHVTGPSFRPSGSWRPADARRKTTNKTSTVTRIESIIFVPDNKAINAKTKWVIN